MAAYTFLFNPPDLCINAKDHFFVLVMVWVWIACGMVFELSLFHTILLSSLLCLDVVCWVIGEFEC